jgi:transcriptional regulator with XRE-family HTH domain
MDIEYGFVLKALGKKIRKLRERRGLSQLKLAELTDLHHTHISGVESGRRNITIRNLRKLAAALDTTISKLAKSIDRKITSLISHPLALCIINAAEEAPVG